MGHIRQATDTVVTHKDTEQYLVLGGNGFIGSHVVDGLVATGKSVRVLDPFRRKPQFSHPRSVRMIHGSAFDPLMLDKALKGVTHVIYSLAATNPFTSDTDPYADIDGLRKGIEILESCVRASVKKVGFISSGGAVYGRLAEKKMAHELDLALPLSPYGICKLAMEHYMEYFNKKYGLEYVVYRLANPYGPRQVFKNGQGVITAFMQRIAAQEDIVIYGDGSVSRDFIYAKDAGRMIAESIAQQNKHTVYNIGSGRLVQLREVIGLLEKYLQKEASLVFVPAPKTALEKTGLDVSRFGAEFGLQNLASFEEGLAETVEHFLASHSPVH